MTAMTYGTKQRLACDIVDFLIDSDMWRDCAVYFEDTAYKSAAGEKAGPDGIQRIEWTTPAGNAADVLCMRDRASEHFRYACDDYVSMSFEGPLYDALNYRGSSTELMLARIFARYGLYFEFGDEWNLTSYPDN